MTSAANTNNLAFPLRNLDCASASPHVRQHDRNTVNPSLRRVRWESFHTPGIVSRRMGVNRKNRTGRIPPPLYTSRLLRALRVLRGANPLLQPYLDEPHRRRSPAPRIPSARRLTGPVSSGDHPARYPCGGAPTPKTIAHYTNAAPATPSVPVGPCADALRPSAPWSLRPFVPSSPPPPAGKSKNSKRTHLQVPLNKLVNDDCPPAARRRGCAWPSCLDSPFFCQIEWEKGLRPTRTPWDGEIPIFWRDDGHDDQE